MSVVVITGASSGIARATALRFARSGASLVLAARRAEVLDEVVLECEEVGASAIAVPTDVTDVTQVNALAATAIERFGRIDVWVNAASVSVYGEFLRLPAEDIRRVLEVNVLGYVNGCRAALNVMTVQKSGAIVNVGSIIGEVPQPFSSPYGMSKAAVSALGVSLRQELALAKQKHITVSTVLPPTIDTPFFAQAGNYTGDALVAMPPVYPPDAVAKAITKAARRGTPEVVVGAPGKALVREHRRHAKSVEAQMALQTSVGQFDHDRSSRPTAGNLYEPASASLAGVTGGWHGKARWSRRKKLGLLLLAGGVGAVAVGMRGRRGWS
jgi:short-subunit dehydrogenase